MCGVLVCVAGFRPLFSDLWWFHVSAVFLFLALAGWVFEFVVGSFRDKQARSPELQVYSLQCNSKHTIFFTGVSRVWQSMIRLLGLGFGD